MGMGNHFAWEEFRKFAGMLNLDYDLIKEPDGGTSIRLYGPSGDYTESRLYTLTVADDIYRNEGGYKNGRAAVRYAVARDLLLTFSPFAFNDFDDIEYMYRLNEAITPYCG